MERNELSDAQVADAAAVRLLAHFALVSDKSVMLFRSGKTAVSDARNRIHWDEGTTCPQNKPCPVKLANALISSNKRVMGDVDDCRLKVLNCTICE